MQSISLLVVLSLLATIAFGQTKAEKQEWLDMVKGMFASEVATTLVGVEQCGIHSPGNKNVNEDAYARARNSNLDLFQKLEASQEYLDGKRRDAELFAKMGSDERDKYCNNLPKFVAMLSAHSIQLKCLSELANRAPNSMPQPDARPMPASCEGVLPRAGERGR